MNFRPLNLKDLYSFKQCAIFDTIPCVANSHCKSKSDQGFIKLVKIHTNTCTFCVFQEWWSLSLQILIDIMELFDYKNLIKDATCCQKDCSPTLNDVILTNVSKSCIKSRNFYTGISDCHNIISTVINSNIAKDEMSKFEYRSFKEFNQGQFLSDLQGIDFSCVQDVVGDAITAYELFESQISQVVNKNAPIKQAYQKRKKSPCMNSINTLKKVIFLKMIFF